MPIEEVEKELIHFLTTSILANEVKIEAKDELKSVGIDSFSIVEIILFIERKFGIILKDEELLPEHFKSVHSIARLILSDH